jgi:hypothetical protein
MTPFSKPAGADPLSAEIDLFFAEHPRPFRRRNDRGTEPFYRAGGDEVRCLRWRLAKQLYAPTDGAFGMWRFCGHSEKDETPDLFECRGRPFAILVPDYP